MYCKRTSNKELAQMICAAVNQAAQKVGQDAYNIHIFLQSYEQDALGGHPHYGVHCDLSYGGDKKAEEAVREELPGSLFCLEDGNSFEVDLEVAWEKFNWAV
jgi:hypothetical protein